MEETRTPAEGESAGLVADDSQRATCTPPPNQNQRDREKIGKHDLNPGVVRVGRPEAPPSAHEGLQSRFITSVTFSSDP